MYAWLVHVLLNPGCMQKIIRREARLLLNSTYLMSLKTVIRYTGTVRSVIDSTQGAICVAIPSANNQVFCSIEHSGAVCLVDYHNTKNTEYDAENYMSNGGS